MIKLKDGRTDLYQWDMGREVTIDSKVDQFHFSVRNYGRTVDVDAVNEGGSSSAKIPDFLLQAPGELHVYAMVGVNTSEYTKVEKTFRVQKRNRPADYVYTPEEQQSIKDVAEYASEALNQADRAQREADRAQEIVDNFDPGTGGTADHTKLTNRDKPDQHPIGAITGLEKALEGKQPKGNYALKDDVPTVPEWAMQPQKPTYTAQEVGALQTSSVDDTRIADATLMHSLPIFRRLCPPVSATGTDVVLERCLKSSPITISGLSGEVKVTHHGKNFFNTATVELDGGVVDGYGIQSTKDQTLVDIKLPKGIYTLSFSRNTKSQIFLVAGKVGSGYFQIIGPDATAVRFNFPGSDDGYLRMKWFGKTLKLDNVQVESAFPKTAFEPYKEETATTSESSLTFEAYGEADVFSTNPTMEITADGLADPIATLKRLSDRLDLLEKNAAEF